MTDFPQNEHEALLAPVIVGEVDDAPPVEGEYVEGEDDRKWRWSKSAVSVGIPD
jgi:hypothetical protein